MELANIPDLPPQGTVIAPHPVEWTDSEGARHVAATEYRHVHDIEIIRKHYPEIFKMCPDEMVFALRSLLRRAWVAPDMRSREWFCFAARQLYAKLTAKISVSDWHATSLQLSDILGSNDPAVPLAKFLSAWWAQEALRDEPPPPNQFESLVFHLQRNLNRALYCPNPECANPFFFARDKGQRYCSDKCAEFGQRQAKLKWWHEHRGKQTRKGKR
jgi:hypothetical protein